MERFDDDQSHKRKRDSDSSDDDDCFHGVHEFFGHNTVCLPYLPKGQTHCLPISIDRSHIVSVHPVETPNIDSPHNRWYKIQTTSNSYLVTSTCKWEEFVQYVHPDEDMHDRSDSDDDDDDDDDSSSFDGQVA